MRTRGLAAILCVVVTLAACGGGEGEGEETADGVAADSTATDSSVVVADGDSSVVDSSVVDSSAAEKIAEAVPVEISLSHVGEISSYLLFSSTVETEEAVEIYSQRGGWSKLYWPKKGTKFRPILFWRN